MTDIHTLTRKLQRKNDSRIILYVGDGLGGLPLEPGGKTELETANTPNLDALAARGVPPGRMIAIGYGETEPIADNETEEGRALNRRTTFTWPN